MAYASIYLELPAETERQTLKRRHRYKIDVN